MLHVLYYHIREEGLVWSFHAALSSIMCLLCRSGNTGENACSCKVHVWLLFILGLRKYHSMSVRSHCTRSGGLHLAHDLQKPLIVWQSTVVFRFQRSAWAPNHYTMTTDSSGYLPFPWVTYSVTSGNLGASEEGFEGIHNAYLWLSM